VNGCAEEQGGQNNAAEEKAMQPHKITPRKYEKNGYRPSVGNSVCKLRRTYSAQPDKVSYHGRGKM
jgi:hypothetical protein